MREVIAETGRHLVKLGGPDGERVAQGDVEVPASVEIKALLLGDLPALTGSMVVLQFWDRCLAVSRDSREFM